MIPTEFLSCVRTGDTATCTAPVGPHRLTVEADYTGTVEQGPCTATHGDRTVACKLGMGWYGHASHTVLIDDGLGLSGTQRAELRAAVPWWRSERDLVTAATWLLGTLAVVAGAIVLLVQVRRRVRPVPPDRRVLVVAGTAALGLGLFVVTAPVLGGTAMLVLSPFALLTTAVLAGWQWQLTGRACGNRVVTPLVTAVAAAVYTGAAMMIILLQAAFID